MSLFGTILTEYHTVMNCKDKGNLIELISKLFF